MQFAPARAVAMFAVMDNEANVLFEVRSGIGHIRLARPKALNALTLPMCSAMLAQLRAWSADAAVRMVVISGEGRAFCAGGDVRALSEDARAPERDGLHFLRVEYPNNAAIKHFPKPFIALLDGIVMGGGVGVSVHGTYRVVTENTLWAMPETLIGFYPDVGGTFFLPRLPGEIGMYLGLTGIRVKAADLLYAGIGTHGVSASRIGDVALHLEAGQGVDTVLADLGADFGPAPLKEIRAAIDRAFSAGSVEEIFERLSNEGEWGNETRALLETRSPTSLKITFQSLRLGRHHGFDECLRMEFRMAARALKGHDFHEGVRAMLIDKDAKPLWKPSSLVGVLARDVEHHFATLGTKELLL